MKILIDGDTFSIFGHVTELLAIAGLAQDGIKQRNGTGGGASRYAIKVTVELDSGAKRAVASVSDVRQQKPTSKPNQAVSSPDSRSRVVSVREAAAAYKVDPRTILRWKDRDPSMIVSGPPYRLDAIPLDAYASGRLNRYRSAA